MYSEKKVENSVRDFETNITYKEKTKIPWMIMSYTEVILRDSNYPM
jgi:hypothetical protein